MKHNKFWKRYLNEAENKGENKPLNNSSKNKTKRHINNYISRYNVDPRTDSHEPDGWDGTDKELDHYYRNNTALRPKPSSDYRKLSNDIDYVSRDVPEAQHYKPSKAGNSDYSYEDYSNILSASHSNIGRHSKDYESDKNYKRYQPWYNVKNIENFMDDIPEEENILKTRYREQLARRGERDIRKIGIPSIQDTIMNTPSPLDTNTPISNTYNTDTTEPQEDTDTDAQQPKSNMKRNIGIAAAGAAGLGAAAYAMRRLMLRRRAKQEQERTTKLEYNCDKLEGDDKAECIKNIEDNKLKQMNELIKDCENTDEPEKCKKEIRSIMST